ncbi:MAG: NAD-dependent protein deacylase [Clostridia bacterium]|nr:NAD-dependent protein deacylase [Clostridia bacterium]
METRLDRYQGARETKLNQLRELIDKSENIVFLGGAGVSTASGIPDFRSGEGIFNQESGLKYRAVDVVSHSFFVEHPEEFYDFYRRKLCYPDAKPNKAHKALARLERQGKLKAIITQNIDNLHQLGGSHNTIELHGSVYRNYCVQCNKKYKLDDILATDGIPHCTRCGGIIRPDVTLYEENLDHSKVDAAIKALKKCDLLIIGGTSLSVYPAATFVQFIKHGNIVIINKSSTYLDLQAKLTIHDAIGEVLDEVVPKRRTKAQIEAAKQLRIKEEKARIRAEQRLAKKKAADSTK